MDWEDTYWGQYPTRRLPTANWEIPSRRRILRIGYPPTVHFPRPLGGAEIFPRVRFPNGQPRRVAVGRSESIPRYVNAFRANKFEGGFLRTSGPNFGGASYNKKFYRQQRIRINPVGDGVSYSSGRRVRKPNVRTRNSPGIF